MTGLVGAQHAVPDPGICSRACVKLADWRVGATQKDRLKADLRAGNEKNIRQTGGGG